jgi:hypothetical protein
MTGSLTTRGQHGGGPDIRPDVFARVLEALIILELVVFLALVAAYIVLAIA